MITKICPNCGSSFQTYPSVDKKHCNAKCSQEMVKKLSYIKYKCECEQCGVEFLPIRQAEGGQFCSYYCRGVSSRKEHVIRNGYWYVFSEVHPNRSRQGYVPVHHIVIETNIGRPVPEGYVVHHINGKCTDNNLSNLDLMTESDHKSLHANKRGRCVHGKFKIF